MLKEKISIIIPLYKGSKYISKLIDMFEECADYNNLSEAVDVEMIFVNDYPNEKAEVLNKSCRLQLHLVSNAVNQGIHASRVNGLAVSTGQYVVFFDQDDEIKKAYLYEQLMLLMEQNGDYVVCNGWKNRFSIIRESELMQKYINDLGYYFREGNLICSPGQVMIRRGAIPDTWMQNIQKNNGADDYLLWILALKQKNKFIYNDLFLYYHSPERTIDSISNENMVKSVEETYSILKKLKVLNVNEDFDMCERLDDLRQKIEKKDKFYEMFLILYKMVLLDGKLENFTNYLKKNGYKKIAVYGMGYIGAVLVEKLKDTDIEVAYAIDKSAVDCKEEIQVYHIEDKLEKVDLILVTIAQVTDKFISEIAEKSKMEVLHIKEILNSL